MTDKFLRILKYISLFLPITFFLAIFQAGSYTISTWIFIRILGLIYFVAFFSFLIQVKGLIGSKGILPVRDFIKSIKENYKDLNFFSIPTLFWFKSNDAFIVLTCFVGIISSLLITFNIIPNIFFIVTFILYLTLVNGGQEFMGYQWDSLLLEVGFLAIFINTHTGIITWMFLWVLFRLMFGSGISKLDSKDPTWRNKTAMNYHYETQPLPTVVGWIAHKSPEFIKKVSVLMTFVIELIIPFLIFIPGYPKYIAALMIIGLQLLIFITGNFTFFNILSISLCLFLLDNKFWNFVLPGSLSNKLSVVASRNMLFEGLQPFLVLIFGTILICSIFSLYKRYKNEIPIEVEKILIFLQNFHILNNYALFATMTTTRYEIILEGSEDAKDWKEYEFKYKPGNLKLHPKRNAPHQPRLDWQMWFATLESVEYNPWFYSFVHRLLEGSKDVLKLLKSNPFKAKQPKYMRATLNVYKFSSLKDLRKKGEWWEREAVGEYMPIISLESFK